MMRLTMARKGENMKFYVNDNCIGCGLCEGTCPDVFKLDGGHAVAADTEVSGSTLSDAQSAMENCPAGAIETK